MPSANDYDPVAELYDVYVRVDFDLAFFRDEAQRTAGAVLELMAGTGRVTAAILEASSNVTCIDRSPGMLRVLHRKLAGRGHGVSVVCADVCALPLQGPYGLVIIPFHSFAELTQADDRRATLQEIRRVLAPGGRFICTLHNPSVRTSTLDGDDSMLGTFQRFDAPGQLELWVRGTLDARARIAESVQVCKLYDSDGALESEHVYSVRFALLEHTEFEEMARKEGFTIVDCYGDYARSPFEPSQSPYMIWVLGGA